MTARGIRNNNPGNIRKSSIAWKGEVVGDDPDFVTFRSATMGIRALAKTLQTYQGKRGLRTIRQIVTRWAPAIENDTEAYIAFVAKAVGIGPDAGLDAADAVVQANLVRAIIIQENGSCPYADDDLLNGVRLALPAVA